jgi:hypothetical protein
LCKIISYLAQLGILRASTFINKQSSLKKGGNPIEQSHGVNSQHQPPGQRTRGSRRSIKNLPSASKPEGSTRAYQRGDSNPGLLKRTAKLQIRRTGSQAARETCPGDQIESVPPGRMVVTGHPPRTEPSGDEPERLRVGASRKKLWGRTP